MNEQLKNKLEIATNDELLLLAIRNIFNEEIENHKPKVEQYSNDELLGQQFRAYTKALNILDDAFENIKSFKNYKENNKVFDKTL